MPADIADYEAIAAVFDHYVVGSRTADAARMARAFHPAATIHGHFRGSFLSGPIQLLFDFVAANPPASGLRALIADVTLAGTAAAARVEIADWNGVRYTDLFALVKADGQWRIITKVFDAHADA